MTNQPPGFPLYGGVDDSGRRWRRPFVDFTTPGRDPRTYRMFIVEPEVRVFDDPASVEVSSSAVALETSGPVKRGDRVRGVILPARFDVQQHGNENQHRPHISFAVSYIRPPYLTDPNPPHIGIERIEVGRVGKVVEAGRAILRHRAVTEGMPADAARQFGTIEVSSADMKRIPWVQMLDKALEMARVFARVDKTYKAEATPGSGRFSNPGGGSFTATIIGLDHDTNTPPVARGRRKRGATTDLHSLPWYHPNVLVVAADCKSAGKTRAETVAHFRAEHDQEWSEHSIKKMWGRCREVGLLPRTEGGDK
jgi:hypothetical protein